MQSREKRVPAVSAGESGVLPEDVVRAKQRFSIVGNSPALNNAIERAVKVAPIDLSVLVTGESGSGKEFFPKIIHYFGSRKHKKYIAVNCGAIPEGTIDSELFGHEKGSFTGAVSARKGYFEEADGGTIFLDEVAELPLTTQARLLRVLETGEYLKVGSSTVQKTDIRIVAATNVDLLQAVAKGKFREDLYYRLSTVLIEVPSLHDRGDDIYLLARKFASDFSQRYMTPPVSFSEEARHALGVYRWPGNVRQLKNIVEQLALFHSGEEITRRQLLEALTVSPREGQGGVPAQSGPSYESERELLWQTLMAMRNEISSLREEVETLRKEGGGSRFASSISDIVGEDRPAHGGALVRKSDYIPFGDTAPETAADASAEAASGTHQDEDAGREAVAEALRRSGGNKRKAAEELNISSRTLYRRIREYGLDEFLNNEP